MKKPHWRCNRCDGSRYHIWEDKSISCSKCGFFDLSEMTVEVDGS